jgi:hypothetical protein
MNSIELEALVLKHEQQIKDLAAHLLELKQFTAMFKPGVSVTQNDVTPMMEFKRREWVGLAGTETNHIFAANVGYPERMMQEVEAKLKDKNT